MTLLADPRFFRLDDLDLLTVLLYGECRGESLIGQLAVAQSVKNRLTSGKWYGGKTVHDVVLRPYQYSCMSPGLGGDNWNAVSTFTDHMLLGNPKDPASLRLESVAALALDNPTDDWLGGATHYYDLSIEAPVWAKAPAHQTAAYGRLRFYAGVA